MTSSNNLKVCRICLESKSVDIIQVETNSEWPELFNFCIGEPLVCGDTVIQFCGKCAEKLQDFGEFKRTCIKSNLLWKSSNVTSKINKDNAEYDPKPKIECDDNNQYNLPECLFNDFSYAEDDAGIDSSYDDSDVKNEVLIKTELISEETEPSQQCDEVKISKSSTHKNLFLCIKCGKSYSKKKWLNRHAKICSKKSKGKFLDTLQSKSKSPTDLKDPQHFNCSICGFYSDKSHEVNDHYKEHIAKEDLNCKLCPFTGKDLADMICHRYNHYPENYNKYICPSCNKCIDTRWKLQFHYRSVHLGLTVGRCFECNKCYKTYRSFKLHMKGHIQPGIRFICDHCHYGTGIRHRIIEHLKSHSTKKSYICDVCGVGFNKRSNLKSHVYYKHAKLQKIKCTHCDKYYKEGMAMKKHLESVSKEKVYVCEVCSKAFATLSELKAHSITHQDEKPHSCNKCDKKFKRLPHLKQHLLWHIGAKPHTCPHCDKAFLSMSSMKRHQSVHTGVRRVKCSYCDKTFYSKFQMLSHCNSKHKREDFQNKSV